ncbi:uncharacterized protein LOC115079619 [Rhinatrema bivittatum]|uniref:uncharacterized protein LOC115079619 n=1 Tax=Rhinatrema bivittatum TaxID=194408 RepID=UPI00112C94FC|nr:uncharacterized protein LOC115079619 [Rhinatrema bivittatum]XP_029439186.1 uncharacterized protein LOC115079619 [Rhinatrema bivittatum]
MPLEEVSSSEVRFSEEIVVPATEGGAMASTPLGGGQSPESLRMDRGGGSILEIPPEISRGMDEINIVIQSAPFPVLKPLERPQNITLESLWLAISTLQTSLMTISEGFKITQDSIFNVKKIMVGQTERITYIEGKIKKVEEVQNSIIKGEVIMNRRMETFENELRNTNIRIINFPKCKLISAKEQFKSYLKDIMKMSNEDMPVINKAYFVSVLKTNTENQMETEEVRLNITEFLETSQQYQVEGRGTLLVKFMSSMDRDIVMKKFLQHRTELYLDQKMWMYPDVSKETQRKRKKFLSLLPQARSHGAQIILRFPCKCVMRVEGQRYVFYDPDQLGNFIQTHHWTLDTGQN